MYKQLLNQCGHEYRLHMAGNVSYRVDTSEMKTKEIVCSESIWNKQVDHAGISTKCNKETQVDQRD